MLLNCTIALKCRFGLAAFGWIVFAWPTNSAFVESPGF